MEIKHTSEQLVSQRRNQKKKIYIKTNEKYQMKHTKTSRIQKKGEVYADAYLKKKRSQINNLPLNYQEREKKKKNPKLLGEILKQK